MRPTVVTDLMSSGDHRPDRAWVLLGLPTDDEEGGSHIERFQNSEKLWRVGPRAVIEREGVVAATRRAVQRRTHCRGWRNTPHKREQADDDSEQHQLSHWFPPCCDDPGSGADRCAGARGRAAGCGCSIKDCSVEPGQSPLALRGRMDAVASDQETICGHRRMPVDHLGTVPLGQLGADHAVPGIRRGHALRVPHRGPGRERSAGMAASTARTSGCGSG